jgi:6,7-dimethyl-8-ribityllumazine synthase
MEWLCLGLALKNVRQDFEEHMGQSILKVSKARASKASAANRAWSGKPPRVAVICASWHAQIVNQARDSLQAELVTAGLAADAVEHFTVPGAFEIPLHAQRLAQTGRYDAVIACALVVNGGIYRHEFVSAAVIDGLMRVQLDTGVPVFSAVLTPRDFHEHEEHRVFFTAHFVHKGREVAQACVKTLHSLRALPAA